MKKVFISLPLNHKTADEIKQGWDTAVSEIKDYLQEDVEVIQSLIDKAPPSGIKCPPLWYLGVSLQFLSQADVAYFAKGWKSARGCKIEYSSAFEYEVDVITCEDVKRIREYRRYLEAKQQ